MNISKWLQENTQGLCGKRVAITGSTGGLGGVLSAYLAELGASLVLLDRNEKRSLAHREQLLARFPHISVDCVRLDLENLVDAEAAVEKLKELKIDVFLHNAGAYGIARRKCASGYDNVFQINFATPYLMIRRLLPDLRERGGRVVVVGSIAHRASEIDENDIDFQKCRVASKVYGNAKRYLMYGLFELLANEPDVSFAIGHPGITPTNITSNYPKWLSAIIKYPMKWIFMSPQKAALSVLYGVFETPEDGKWIGPACLDIWGLPKIKALRGCSVEERAQIAAVAEKVYRDCCDCVSGRQIKIH